MLVYQPDFWPPARNTLLRVSETCPGSSLSLNGKRNQISLVAAHCRFFPLPLSAINGCFCLLVAGFVVSGLCHDRRRDRAMGAS